MLNAGELNSKLATRFVYRNTSGRYSIKVSPRTGQRKYLLSTKY